MYEGQQDPRFDYMKPEEPGADNLRGSVVEVEALDMPEEEATSPSESKET